MRVRALTFAFICLCAAPQAASAYPLSRSALNNAAPRLSVRASSYLNARRLRAPLKASTTTADPSTPPYVLTTLKCVPVGRDQVTNEVLYGTSLSNEELGTEAILLEIKSVNDTAMIGLNCSTEDFLLKAVSVAPRVAFFVHGYNDPAGSVLELWRNLSIELKGGDILVVPIIWPAQIPSTKSRLLQVAKEIGDYFKQRREIVPSSAKFLAKFLTKVLKYQSDKKAPIHLVLHSMGNYLIQLVSDEIEADPTNTEISKIQKTFMAAADVDYDIFAPTRKLEGRIADISEQVFVMWSRKDEALLVSKVGNSCPRLGRTGLSEAARKLGNPPANCEDFDCSEFKCVDEFGHNYFTSAQAKALYLREMVHNSAAS